MMKKRYVIISILLVIILIIAFFIYKNKNIKLVDGTKSISNIVFKKSKIKKEKGIFYFVSTIESIDKLDKSRVDIIIKAKNGTILDTLEYNISKLKPNTNKKIKIKSNNDLSNAYKVSFTVYK